MLKRLRATTATNRAVRWREPIVVDHEDRDRFRELLGELVQQTGWEVFAWVLMTRDRLIHQYPVPLLAC